MLAFDTLASLSFSIKPVSAQSPGAINPGVQLQEQLRESADPVPKYEKPKEFDPNDDAIDIQSIKTLPEDQPAFFFKAVRVSGNKEVRTGVLVKPFLPLIGKDVTFDQLKLAASRAELNYKNQGFITTKVIIPAQDIKSGNIVIQVIEGFIEDLQVRGATPGLQAYFRKMLQPIVNVDSSKIFNYKKFERKLLQIRDFGGVKFSSTLLKGTKLGSSILVFDLKTDSFDGFIGANNNISDQLGDFQINANAQYVFPISQPIKLTGGGSYSFPFNGGLVTGLAGISSPIGNEGFIANALWSTSSTSSKDLFDGDGKLQTVGSSNYWSLGAGYPLILKRNSKLMISLNGTGQNSTNDLYLDGSQVTDLSTDKIRAIRLSLDGYFASERSVSSASFRLSQGIGGLGDDLAVDEFKSNANSKPNFTSALLNLSRSQKIFDFGTFLTVKASGQLSSTSLPSPEAFTYGGPLYGRAFKNVYILGDQGASGSIEVSQRFDFSLFNNAASISPYSWYDIGTTEYKEGPLSSQTASTYGIGLRGNAYNTKFELGWGIPATNTLKTTHVGTSNSILYFNAGWRF
jgi:hemolysin activation/secretion protein